MPREPSTTQPVVILHGWYGSGPEHWQTWLAGRLAAEHEVRYPALPDPDEPRLDRWLSALDETTAGLPAGGYDVVCHSLAVLLWLHRVARGPIEAPPARVLLVAPPSAQITVPEVTRSFLPAPLDVDAVRSAAGGTILVCSDNDPYCPEGAAVAYGLPLKLPVTVLPGAGHLNPETGYGPWPAVHRWCSRPNLAFPL